MIMPVLLKSNGKNKIRSILILLVASLLLVTGGLSLFRSAHAFPTNTAVLDNFNRADTTNVSSSPASGPYDWAPTQINSGLPTELGIISNQLYKANNGNNGYINHLFGPDTEVNIDVNVPPSSGSYVVLWARIQDPGSGAFDSYALVYINNGANATWSLRRYDNSAMTELATLNTPLISAGDSLGFAVTGTGSAVTLTAYQQSAGVWSTIGSVNDNSASRITSSGYIGTEVGDSTMRLDNLRGGDVINNTPPTAPDLSLPADNATGISTSPQFQLRATDADGDNLQYKIEVCADAACSSIIRTIDQTSSQTGWSGQDKAGGTAYTGGTSLAASTLAVHNYQAPSLDNSTQYWWRAYAIDPSGTNAFSPASGIFSFTTEAVAQNGGTTPGNSGSGNSSNPSKTDPNLTPSSYAQWGK